METIDQAASIWRRIIEIAELLHDRAKVLDEADDAPRRLPVAQAKVFIHLCERRDEDIRLKDLAKRLSLTPGTVSPLVEALVREGLVERHPDPRDRRALHLRPTARGLQIHEVRTRHITELVDQLLGSFSGTEVSVLHDSLNRLYTLLNGGIPPPDDFKLPVARKGDAR